MSSLCLTDLEPHYAIDTSGSTIGFIFHEEKLSALEFKKYFTKPETVYAWNLGVQNFRKLEDITCIGGGTDPNCLLSSFKSRLLPKSNESVLIFYTDGCIAKQDIVRWQNNLSQQMNDEFSNVPLIFIFALESKYNDYSTLQEIKSQVDMSIVEGFLSSSNHVLILFTISEITHTKETRGYINPGSLKHYIFSASGIFSTYFKLNDNLEDQNILSSMPLFDFNLLNQVNCQKLNKDEILLQFENNSIIVKLSQLYNSDELHDLLEFYGPHLIQKLQNRSYFGKYQNELLYSSLSTVLQKLSQNNELIELNQKLALCVIGSEQHKQLLQEYNQIKSKKIKNKDPRIQSIMQFMEQLKEYKQEKTSFTFKSNRALYAKEVEKNDYDFTRENCIEITDCPIMLSEGSACILLKKTNIENNILVEQSTSDFNIDAPFAYGSSLVEFMTPGIFSEEFANQATIHPFTREKIIGYIPLVTKPIVLIAHMSKYFSGSKKMDNLVYYYISMITFAIEKYNYIKEHENLFKQQLIQLFDHFYSYKTFSQQQSGTIYDVKIPLKQCFEYVLLNEGIALVLRNRLPSDTRAIMKITDWLFPEIIYSKDQIIGLTNVLEDFGFMLNRLKEGQSMTKYIMDSDNDYGHFLKEKTDLKSLIARIFWFNHSKSNYVNSKFQLALNNALNDSCYGPYLQKALMNENFYDGSTCFEIAADEPDEKNVHFHFTDEMALALQTQSFYPIDHCIYCKHTFSDPSYLYNHLKTELKGFFMTIHRKVIEVILEAMCTSSDKEYQSFHVYRDGLRPYKNSPLTLKKKELFFAVKDKLERKFGKAYPILYTQYCKKSILFYLDNLSIFFRIQDRFV